MLPHPERGLPWAALAALLASVFAAAGCAERQTPEQQVRAVIDRAEAAAEERDLSGILEHVSAGFQDGQGGGREELKQSVAAYLLTHPAVHLVTRVESVEFPYRDLARVVLTVGSLARDGTDESSLDFAADVKEVALELRLEGDAWKVTRARWR